MASFGTDLIDIMNTSGENYSSKFRNEIVKALILLRGKEMVPAQPLYELFFKLFRVKDSIETSSVLKLFSFINSKY